MKRVSKAFSRLSVVKQPGDHDQQVHKSEKGAYPPALPKSGPEEVDENVNNENAPRINHAPPANKRSSIRRSLMWKSSTAAAPPIKPTPPLPPKMMMEPELPSLSPPPLPPKRLPSIDLSPQEKEDNSAAEEESLKEMPPLPPTVPPKRKQQQWILPSLFTAKRSAEHAATEEEEGQDVIEDLPSFGRASKRSWRFSAMRRTSKRKSNNATNVPQFYNESIVTLPMMLHGSEINDDDDEYSYELSATGKFNELPSALYFESATHAEHPANPDYPLTAIIILSLGEATWMCGPASLEYPEAQFPAICGKPHKHLKRVELTDSFDGPERISFGCDAERKKLLDLEWFNDTDNGATPKYVLVGDALVYNSDHLLRRPLKQDAVMLPMNQEYSWERKTKLALLCFERIGARAVRICSEELMALQHMTQNEFPTGIVVDMGQTHTRVVCFLQGERCEVTLRKTRAAGRAVTLRMQRMMQELESVFTQSKQGMEFARQVKEKVGFVRPKNHIGNECDVVSVEYSPGSHVLLQSEMHLCAEILFNPSSDEGGMLAYADAPSVQNTLLDCLKENDDRDTWEELLSNVVVYGGTSRLPGMETRLVQEVKDLLDVDPMTASKASVLKRKLNIRVMPEAGWAGARELLDKEAREPIVPNRKWISRMYWKNGGETGLRVRLEKLSRGDESCDFIV